MPFSVCTDWVAQCVTQTKFATCFLFEEAFNFQTLIYQLLLDNENYVLSWDNYERIIKSNAEQMGIIK